LVSVRLPTHLPVVRFNTSPERRHARCC
jgi:hypothetical protein